MLFTSALEGLAPRFEVSGIFIESEGNILLLHRHPDKPQGKTWCVPAGKIDGDESAASCMVRELREETGIILPDTSPEYVAKTFVKYTGVHFVYHVFRATLASRPDVRINQVEHTEFRWVTPNEALQMQLIQDEDACIRLCFPAG